MSHRESVNFASARATNQQAEAAPAAEFVPFAAEDVERSIPWRFDQQVARHPERVAVKTRKRQLTYRELQCEANRLARAIVERRGSAQEPVAYLVSDDAKMVIAILGILKAGKIFVPLNIEHPASRNRLSVEDAQALITVVDDTTLKAAAEIAVESELLNIDAIKTTEHGLPKGVELSGDSFAAILYSAGSTGQPKGVLQDHRFHIHNTMHHTNGLRITPSDRLTLLSSRASQQAMTGIFSAMMNGAGLYPFRIKEEGLERLANWIEEEKITVYHSSASVFRQFAKSLSVGRTLGSVRVVKLGSESVSRSDFELWRNHFSRHCIFVNALSSTESGTIRQFVAYPSSVIEGNKIPAGFAVQDMEILLLDETGVPVKPGEVGEIAVRSRFVFPGYWRKPEETKQAFVGEADAGGRRTYRTGDLGQLLPDGCLLHRGRKDFRVKIRGNRVELAEIEMALAEIAGVRQAVVTAEEKTPENPRLVAYIVAKEEPTPKGDYLRSELRKKLPDYMIPAVYVFLKELPLTPQGKVDRRALPAPRWEDEIIASCNSVELLVAEIWKEVLGTDCVDKRQNFFEAGGDSLLAIRMIDELEQAFRKKLTPEIFVNGGTVHSLASRLMEEWEQAPPALFLSAPGAAIGPPLFLLHGDYSTGGLYAIKLARLLGKQWSLCTVQPLRKQGYPLPTSLATMAEENLGRLVTTQAHGPYRLAGYCHGGLIALEMAQRLKARGETVELLVVIDAIARNASLRFYHKLVGAFSSVFHLSERQRMDLFLRAKCFVESVRGQEKSKRFVYVIERLWKAAARRLPRFVGVGPKGQHPAMNGASRAVPYNLVQKVDPAYEERTAHFERLVRSYVPEQYDGEITLLASTDRLRENQDRTLGWNTVAKNVKVRVLPGNHQTCITTFLPALAEELKRCLAGPKSVSSAGSSINRIA